jgi:hypothetical protein
MKFLIVQPYIKGIYIYIYLDYVFLYFQKPSCDFVLLAAMKAVGILTSIAAQTDKTECFYHSIKQIN